MTTNTTKTAVVLYWSGLVASIVNHGDGEYSSSVTIMCSASDGEHSFTPAQSIKIEGIEAITALRDALNNHFPYKPTA